MTRDRLRKKRETSTVAAQTLVFAPVRTIEIEIGQALPIVSAWDEKTSHHYQRAICLVRLHTHPLGVVELQLSESGVNPEEYALQIWQTLSAQITAHLRQDGLPEVTGLDAAGLQCSSTPRCIEEREQFLAHAPFVSVIVPTHDRPERVGACLRSLLALRYPQYEIIVVDNAPSADTTAELIQQTYRDVPQVRYLREDRPGPSWARNCGMMAARGEILAFVDDDMVVDPYWLVELVKAFSFADDVVCVTGLILPLELETPAQFLLEEYGGFGKGFTRRVFDTRENRPKMPLYPYTMGLFGSGGSMAFTAAFLHSAGGFDPVLGGSGPAQGGEDIAMFFQAVIGGHKLVYEPAALAYHLHQHSYADLRKQMYSYGVGPIACLMKSVLENPKLLFDLIPKLPYGLFFILSGRSTKNNQKSAYYPKELTILELKGMLYGPFAYLLSRWATPHVPKSFVLVDPPRLYQEQRSLNASKASLREET